MDPSRLVNNASGWTDKNCGDVIDVHNYPGPGSPVPEENRAAVLGEFGGLGLAVDGHTWSNKTWGYKDTQDHEDLTRNYEKLLAKAWALKDKAGLSACIYTQITDVETECNGLLTYDRAVHKVIPGAPPRRMPASSPRRPRSRKRRRLRSRKASLSGDLAMHTLLVAENPA